MLYKDSVGDTHLIEPEHESFVVALDDAVRISASINYDLHVALVHLWDEWVLSGKL